MPEIHEMMANAQQWRNLCTSQGIHPSVHWIVIQRHFEANVALTMYFDLVIGATEGCLVG